MKDKPRLSARWMVFMAVPALFLACFLPGAIGVLLNTPYSRPQPSRFPYPPPGEANTRRTPIPSETRSTLPLSFEVLVKGLEGNDTAELQILPGSEQTASDLQALGVTLPTVSLRNEAGRVSIPAIPVGTYKLVIWAPGAYFREPGGYLFQVTQAGMVNPSGTPLRFRLIPPAAQDLPPCREIPGRGSLSSPGPTGEMPFEEGRILCRAERLIDLSGPPKAP